MLLPLLLLPSSTKQITKLEPLKMTLLLACWQFFLSYKNILIANRLICSRSLPTAVILLNFPSGLPMLELKTPSECINIQMESKKVGKSSQGYQYLPKP